MTALELVLLQAEDEALWFMAEHVTEAYLQQALRNLHAAVERDAGHPSSLAPPRGPRFGFADGAP
jgi:hypothetical protein